MRVLPRKFIFVALLLFAATGTHGQAQPTDGEDPAIAAEIQSVIDASLARHAECLAAKGSPRDLLAAALVLPRAGLEDTAARRAAESQASEWLAKARLEAEDDTLFDWVERIDCTAGMPDCDGIAALKRLANLQPGNSWVWLELLAEASVSQQEDTAWMALQRAAEAPHAASPYLDYVRVLHGALGRWPLTELTDEQREFLGRQYGLGRAIKSDELRASLMLNRLLSIRWPTLHAAVASLCLPGKLPEDAGIAKRKHCVDVAELLARDGSTQSAHLAGLELRIRIASDETDRAEWIEELRRTAWELEQLSHVQERISMNPEQLQNYVKRYVEKGEVAAIRDLLEQYQIPAPPKDWLPESPLFNLLIREGRTPAD